MNGPSGVSGSKLRDFTDEELAALRKDESTSAVVNKARRDAGFKEGDVSVRGDDPTLDEVLHHKPSHVSKGEVVGTLAHAFEVIEAVKGAEGVLHTATAATRALHLAPHVALPLLAFGAAQYGMYEMEKTKLAMKDAATRDQLHAAIVDKLEVPEGFKRDEIKRLGVSFTKQSAANKISDQLDLTDKHLLATLQLHCDKGMNAARDMIEAGKSPEQFMKENPTIAEQYAADPAFKNGFDALVWAKKDSPATYESQTEGLKARDVRYSQASIQYRL